MSSNWSNLAKIIYRRTYSRKDTGVLEKWEDTVERVIRGNTRKVPISHDEEIALKRLFLERKGIPAGRGLWFSGSPSHERLGGCGAVNCWFFTADDWEHFVLAQDMLMLGGGVGLSVEHRFVSKLPKIKKGVNIVHRHAKDTDFIIPDSREGWCELTRRVLESYFVTGKSFSYSTICIRGAGESIKGFGGLASGPIPLISFVEKLCAIFKAREGRSLRPIDAADIICATGEMVVAGNVRRSAIIILGDPWDKVYLAAKRWSLGNIPTYRSTANFSVVADDVEDLHPAFWKTYEDGEPFGIVNRTNMQKFGRMGELKPDKAMGVNPCAEIQLENGEACNLLEIPLLNITSVEEFEYAARLLFRYGKRVSMEDYHNQISANVIKRNQRIGVGITGCLASPLFNPTDLDRVYKAIQEENVAYSKELGVPQSIRTTTIKPSGTVSKLTDQFGYEGIHPSYSRYMIQRVRFAANDPLIPVLRAAGHYMEPQIRFDGTFDNNTLVVDFYQKAPDGFPVADEDWDTWKQLESVKMAQKYWSDNSVSVTVYYKKEDIPAIKVWLAENLSEIKTISFLLHSEHGFKQAPKEAITKEQYERFSAKVKPINIDVIGDGELESQECASGACPIR